MCSMIYSAIALARFSSSAFMKPSVFETEYKDRYAEAGLTYEHRLIESLTLYCTWATPPSSP